MDFFSKSKWICIHRFFVLFCFLNKRTVLIPLYNRKKKTKEGSFNQFAYFRPFSCLFIFVINISHLENNSIVTSKKNESPSWIIKVFHFYVFEIICPHSRSYKLCYSLLHCSKGDADLNAFANRTYNESINSIIIVTYKIRLCGGARGVMVIVVGNGHGDTSSNPRWDWLHFTEH